MKLHLGCGKRKIKNWVNVDIDRFVMPDIVDDCGQLDLIKDESADIIYACHILEHFGRHAIVNVLKLWHKKLKVGGILRIAVPDFQKVVTAYNFAWKYQLSTLLGLLVGGQKNEWDHHHMVFDFQSLSEYLTKAGFLHPRRYDWKETEHHYIDDYSQCYLPHMDKGSGLLMSLNVECTKL